MVYLRALQDADKRARNAIPTDLITEEERRNISFEMENPAFVGNRGTSHALLTDTQEALVAKHADNPLYVPPSDACRRASAAPFLLALCCNWCGCGVLW